MLSDTNVLRFEMASSTLKTIQESNWDDGFHVDDEQKMLHPRQYRSCLHARRLLPWKFSSRFIRPSSIFHLQLLKNTEKWQTEKKHKSSAENTNHETAIPTAGTPAQIKLLVLLDFSCYHPSLFPAHQQYRNLASGDLWCGYFGVDPYVCLKA